MISLQASLWTTSHSAKTANLDCTTRTCAGNPRNAQYNSNVRKRRCPQIERRRPDYCTSLYILLGAGGIPPFSGGPLDWGLEFDPFDACGAGRIGRDI